MLLPAAGYKGYGLALMFECFSSVMMGNPLLLPKLLNRQPAPPMGTQNCVIAAINIGLFTDLTGYEQNIDDMAGAIKALPKANGFEEIMLPGELEDRTYDERFAKGIPAAGRHRPPPPARDGGATRRENAGRDVINRPPGVSETPGVCSLSS